MLLTNYGADSNLVLDIGHTKENVIKIYHICIEFQKLIKQRTLMFCKHSFNMLMNEKGILSEIKTKVHCTEYFKN